MFHSSLISPSGMIDPPDPHAANQGGRHSLQPGAPLWISKTQSMTKDPRKRPTPWMGLSVDRLMAPERLERPALGFVEFKNMWAEAGLRTQPALLPQLPKSTPLTPQPALT